MYAKLTLACAFVSRMKIFARGVNALQHLHHHDRVANVLPQPHHRDPVNRKVIVLRNFKTNILQLHLCFTFCFEYLAFCCC